MLNCKLPGDVWTMLSLGCFTPMGGVNKSPWTDPGGVKHCFSTLKKKVLMLSNWWQGRMPVEWVIILRLPNLPYTLLWTICCLEWWDECDLVGLWVYHLVRLIGRSVCSKKLVEDFWDVHFACVTVENRVADSNMNGFSSFSGTLFAVFVYYVEVGGVCSVVFVGHVVYVNSIGDMTIVFLCSIFQTSAVCVWQIK